MMKAHKDVTALSYTIRSSYFIYENGKHENPNKLSIMIIVIANIDKILSFKLQDF